MSPHLWNVGAVVVACLLLQVAPAARAVAGAPQRSLYAWGEGDLLPFPNDQYTRADPSTPTGLRVSIPEGAWPDDLLDAAPFDARYVVRLLEDRDGFSPNLPVLFTVSAELSPDSLPDVASSRTAESPIALINLDALARIPFRVFSQVGEAGGKRFTLVVLSPWNRLEHGRRYAVVVRKDLVDAAGRPIPPPAPLARVLDGTAGSTGVPGREVQRVQRLADTLQSLGYARADPALLFEFTVESRESYLQPLTALDARIERRRDTVRYAANRLRVHLRPLKGDGEARLQGTGTFTALRFVDKHGRVLDEPREQTLKFLLRLPDHCPPGGCPVAIFGHGLSATRGTMFQVSDALAARGIATIATNTIWHNSMIQSLKVVVGTRWNLNLFLATFLEHILRNVQLVEVIRQDLAMRDLRPASWIEKGRGAPLHIRADRIFYIGQSLGGLCGVATCFLAPDIRAAVFDVAGGSAVDMMFDSHLKDMMGVPLSTFPGLDERQSLDLAPLATYLMDLVDPLGYAPFLMASPIEGQSVRLVAQQAGVGDGLVPNWTTEKLARALGIPLAWERDHAPRALPGTSSRGPALRYYHFTDNWFLAHLELFHSAPAVADFFDWSAYWLGVDEDPAGSRAQH